MRIKSKKLAVSGNSEKMSKFWGKWNCGKKIGKKNPQNKVKHLDKKKVSSEKSQNSVEKNNVLKTIHNSEKSLIEVKNKIAFSFFVNILKKVYILKKGNQRSQHFQKSK